MYHGQADVVWLLPLFLAGLFLLASSLMWWRVAYGKKLHGVDVKPSEGDLRQAASVSALALGLLALSILAAFGVRF